VESGRSAPSRDFLSTVSDALNIPLRERNILLLASGFAPKYSEQSMDAEQMAIVNRAIDRMLRQYEPIGTARETEAVRYFRRADKTISR